MRIAILGATSQIARDLIISFSAAEDKHLHLYARRLDEVKKWLRSVDLAGRYPTDDFSKFGNQEFDAIINFVGSGDPARTAAMGASILDVTLQYDEIALDYVKQHPACRYLFLSSGAAYGSSFNAPVDVNTKATIAINNLQPQDWYAVAKLHAECRHRAHPELHIIDIRVFNYFSRTQDIEARFLVTDILRAIRDKTVFKTSPDYIVRDYLHPLDFYRLICSLLQSPASNASVDSYTLAPVDKPELLFVMQERFGLRYETVKTNVDIASATGIKPCYYSLNHRAADFGYIPSKTSIESIISEAAGMLNIVNQTILL